MFVDLEPRLIMPFSTHISPELKTLVTNLDVDPEDHQSSTRSTTTLVNKTNNLSDSNEATHQTSNNTQDNSTVVSKQDRNLFAFLDKDKNGKVSLVELLEKLGLHFLQ